MSTFVKTGIMVFVLVLFVSCIAIAVYMIYDFISFIKKHMGDKNE